MMPTENTKRLLLQQHLLQRSLTQQLAAANANANARQLQTPTMGSAAACSVAASGTSLSAIHQQMAATTGAMGQLGRGEASLSPSQQPKLSANLILRLLAADQENRLKRRLSEMQQQHRQQQHILLAATQGRIERPPKDMTSAFGGSLRSSAQNSELLARLQQKHLGSTSSTLVASNLPSPVKAAAESRETTPVVRAIEKKDPKSTRDTELERTPVEGDVVKRESIVSVGGVSRKDARWREMYEELLAYKQKTGTCTVPRGYPENPRLASWVAEQR